MATLEQADDLERKDAHQDCCIYSPDSNANANKRPATTLCSIRRLFILFISMFIIPEHEVFLFPEECILPTSHGTHP